MPYPFPGFRSAAPLVPLSATRHTGNVSQDTPGLRTMAIRMIRHLTDLQSSTNAPYYPVSSRMMAGILILIFSVIKGFYRLPHCTRLRFFVVNSEPTIQTALFQILAGDANGHDIYGFNNGTSRYDFILISLMQERVQLRR